MYYLDRLHHNLTSGESYLTSQSDDCERDGEIIYGNILTVASILFGDDVIDQDYEYLIDEISNGSLDAYNPDLDAQAASEALREKWSGE